MLTIACYLVVGPIFITDGITNKGAETTLTLNPIVIDREVPCDYRYIRNNKLATCRPMRDLFKSRPMPIRSRSLTILHVNICLLEVATKAQAKTKTNNTYIAPQAAYRSCSSAFVSQTEWAHSLCRAVQARANELWHATKQPYAALICRLIVSVTVIWITTHLPGVMKGRVGLVGEPIVDTLPTKWSHVNRRSGIGDVVRQPKTDVLTTEPRRQPIQHVYIIYYK